MKKEYFQSQHPKKCIEGCYNAALIKFSSATKIYGAYFEIVRTHND